MLVQWTTQITLNKYQGAPGGSAFNGKTYRQANSLVLWTTEQQGGHIQV